MENGQNLTALRTEDSIVMKPPIDQREHMKSHTDLMARRQKNRERQRRYRARKRLEAFSNKSYVVNHSTTLPEEPQLIGIHNNSLSRIHCKRDWKKDARRAHASKELEVTSNVLVAPALTLVSESQTSCLPCGINAETPQERKFHSENSLSLVNCETARLTLGRRDWKAEARKKKS